ncbi:MAG: hypothetical protein HY717_06780 [Planctomycetes bacterium]|nr:hypothetical protein [Planctomycetota bacterium]
MTKVRQTIDGGFIAIGGTESEWASDDCDLLLLRVDSRGNELWKKTYGGPGYDHGSSIEQTGDGGFIAGAVTASCGAGKTDFLLLKLSASGGLEWQKTYGGEGWEGQYENGPCARQTMDGGFILAGSTDSASLKGGRKSVAAYLVRTDALGNKLWEKTYGDPEAFVIGYTVEPLSDGGFIVGGVQENKNPGIILLRADSNGRLLWERIFRATDACGLVKVSMTWDGGFLLGNRDFMAAGWVGAAALILRTDASGNLLLEKRIERGGFDRIVCAWQTKDLGTIALCNGYVVKLAPERKL